MVRAQTHWVLGIGCWVCTHELIPSTQHPVQKVEREGPHRPCENRIESFSVRQGKTVVGLGKEMPFDIGSSLQETRPEPFLYRHRRNTIVATEENQRRASDLPGGFVGMARPELT